MSVRQLLFIMISWLRNLTAIPDTRERVSIQSVHQKLLPLFICYYTFAVLVLLRNTRYIRLQILPLTLWLTFRSITRLDFSFDGRYPAWNFAFGMAMGQLALRVTFWASRSTPLTKKTKSKENQVAGVETDIMSPRNIFLNALDLIADFRGCQWKWSGQLHIAKQTRPTSSGVLFSSATLLSLIVHTFIADFLHHTLRYLNTTILHDNTIFQDSLTYLRRYALAGAITATFGIMTHSLLQIIYDIFTLLGVLFQGQHPLIWPPLFDSPLRATSLEDLWARRWHQMMRGVLIPIGYKPGAFIAGRVGGVLCTFLVSGLLHEVGFWSMGKGVDFTRVTGCFVMVGVGIMIEGVWTKLTGNRIGGILGMSWTWAWMVFWGSGFVDTVFRVRLLDSAPVPDFIRPSHYTSHYLPMMNCKLDS